jgi:hypothetical protein
MLIVTKPENLRYRKDSFDSHADYPAQTTEAEPVSDQPRDIPYAHRSPIRSQYLPNHLDTFASTITTANQKNTLML